MTDTNSTADTRLVRGPGKAPIRLRFDCHGLGDVVAAVAAFRLYMANGYEVQLQVEDNKRWLFEAAGIPIHDGPEKFPLHPYYYPDMNKFWDLSTPDCVYSKIAHLFEVKELPKLGSKEDVWAALCAQQIDVTSQIPPEAHVEAESFLEGMPRPIFVVHTRGTNWAEEKSLSTSVAFDLIVTLLKITTGSVIVLDYDCRAPMVGDARCKGIKPSWGHIGIDRLCALLQRTDLMIGIDSGPFHVAGLVAGVKALGVFRKIPPVRCCLPNSNATYLVPDRDHDQWEKRSSQWKFLEYEGDSPTGEEIAEIASQLAGGMTVVPMTLEDLNRVAGTYIYHRVGHDQRPMELLGNGRIGVGAAGCERRWHPEPIANGWRIAVVGDSGEVEFRASLYSDGTFRGRWLRNERMPIELIPSAPSATSAAVDISNGQHQQWTPDEAAKVFPTYQRDWNLPVATRGNGKIWLIDDKLLHSNIDLHDHEDWIFKHLMVPNGGFYVDVGGYIGSDAIYVAQSCNASVVVVEPVPLHQEMIRKNAILNGVNLQLIPCAAGAVEGKTWMDCNSMNSLQTTEGDGIEVQCRTLDDICQDLPRLDVIKIDVEGAECDVVAGGLETIRKHRPKLIIEVHGHFPGRQENGAILAAQFQSLNYSFRRIWKNTDAYFYIEATPNKTI